MPVVGYRNQALGGTLALADVGVGVAMDEVAAAAATVRALDADRPLLARNTRHAVAFARRHSFGDTTRRRIDHLVQLGRGARRGSPS